MKKMTQKFTHETLLLHSTASNTKFEIDVWRYNHPDATQTVYLQGGIHGIELTGILCPPPKKRGPPVSMGK